jgi:uncharacterized protein YraI
MTTSRIQRAACVVGIALAVAVVPDMASAQTITMQTSARLPLREGPVADSPVRTDVPSGAAVEVGICENEWCEARFGVWSGYLDSRQLLDPGNRVQENEFPQCRGAGIRTQASTTSTSPYSREYVQSWLRLRRDGSSNVSVPGLGTQGPRIRRIREVRDSYFHIHLGELNGREEHFCVPYAAVKSLEAVESGPGKPTEYRIILFTEWVTR